MKKDFERIRAIHDLQSAFKVTPETLDALVAQIEETDKRQNVERFLKGYAVEDTFEELFSQLPVVELLHAVKQEQSPSESKTEYQVPDFIVFLRSLEATIFPVFVETKSVLGKKVTLSVMPKQVTAVNRYSEIHKHPIVYAIYWEKFGLWTVNSVDQFALVSSEYRISFEAAYMNDLSGIFGDETVMFMTPVFRRSSFDRARNDGVTHAKYGGVVTDEVSSDGENFVPLEPLEGAVIDSTINLKETRRKTRGSITYIEEKSAPGYMLKLTTIIPRHLSTSGGMDMEEKTIRASQHTIWSLAKKLVVRFSTSVPRDKTGEADELMKLAFGDSAIWRSYATHPRQFSGAK